MSGLAFLRLLETDRGGLSLSRQDGSLLLRRHVDSRLADKVFRDRVAALASAIELRRPPRVLPILRHEQIGDHYSIEYELPAAAESLRGCFTRTHWLERLALARSLLRVYSRVRKVAVPLGLHAGTIVACHDGAEWQAFLALCPALDLAAADDLVDCDPWVLSGIAPERVRCTPDLPAQEDTYGAGVLVLLALGARPAPDLSGEDAVEAQARAAFLSLSPEHSDVEPVLRRIPYLAVRLEELERLAFRCIHFSPAARPDDLEELEKACDEVLTVSNAETFAVEVESKGNAADALRLLEWAINNKRDCAGVRQSAVRLCEKMGLASRELQHLEKLIDWRPWDDSVRRRRWRLRYEAHLNRPRRAAETEDPEGDWLLGELDRLRPAGTERLDHEQRALAKEDRMSAAMIYDWRGDLYGRAREMHEMTKLDYQDIEALLLYGLSCREIALQEDLPLESRAQARKTLEGLLSAVEDRVSRLAVAGILDGDAVKPWIARFQSLLLS